jgi:hypothetical protein
MIHVGTPYTASTLDSSRPSKRPRCNDEESGEEATSSASASEPALPHTPKRQRQDVSAPAAVRPVPTLVPTPVFTLATAPPSPRASLASPQSSPSFAFLPVPAPAPAPLPTGPAAAAVLVPTAVPALVLVSTHAPPPASASAPAPARAPTRKQSGRCAYYLSTPAFTSLTRFVQRANTAGVRVTRSDARNIPVPSGRMMVRALRTHRVRLASSSASRVCGQGARVAKAPCSLPRKQLLGPFLRSTDSQPDHIISAAFCAASRGTLYDPVQGTHFISYSLLLCPCLYRSSSPLFEVCRR